jgi:hypothetical protein
VDHLVRFTTAEGRDAQHVSPSLDDALRFVERLRNNEEASTVRVFRLQEVPIAFKAYYKAELRPVDAPETAVEVPVAPAEARHGPSSPVPAPTEVESPEQQARKLFSRG